VVRVVTLVAEGVRVAMVAAGVGLAAAVVAAGVVAAAAAVAVVVVAAVVVVVQAAVVVPAAVVAPAVANSTISSERDLPERGLSVGGATRLCPRLARTRRATNPTFKQLGSSSCLLSRRSSGGRATLGTAS
jgi:fatty acid desaturase